jgi:AraC family transcriptional regulator of adaptative response/methylated-DNA-[protein]-cysteine methyltransferase
VAAYLDTHVGQRTKLEDVAKATGVGRFTILRGFKRVLGVSPGEYVKAKKLESFRDKVKPEKRVTDAIYEAGFGSSSRLYEGADAKLGMTPTAMRAGGAGVAIRYAIARSALGKMLVAATERGVCAVAFADTDAELVKELRERFAKAKIVRDDAGLGYAVRWVAAHLGESAAAVDLPMDVRATAFQERVWRELRAIPRGETRTYAQIARQLGKPAAVRAVAAACAANPVAVVVPCHRVVGSDGKMTGYRWGVERKRKLLADERG